MLSSDSNDIIYLLQCLHKITHTGVIHADKLNKFGCEMRCFCSFQMCNTTKYLYAQYNKIVLSKKIRFGSSYLNIRAEIDTTMAVVK